MIINDINEKFENSLGKKSERYYEFLHSSLSIVLGELTKEQWNAIPLPQQKAIEKLEREILALVSNEYLESFKSFADENERFKKPTLKGEKHLINKCKNKIGFLAGIDEGITI